LENATIEATFKAMFFLHFPLSVDYRKCYVFVWGTSVKSNSQSICGPILLQKELGSSSFVRQIWEENVEFVSLDLLWRRVFRIIVRLVILVPLVALLDTIEESWFSKLEFPFLILICLDDIAEFCLILAQTLLLNLCKHSQRWIVKASLVYDVESNSGIQGRFLDYFIQTWLYFANFGLLKLFLEFFFFFKPILFCCRHFLKFLSIFGHKYVINTFDLRYKDFFAHQRH